MAISHQEVYRGLATLLNAGFDLKRALHTSVVKRQGPLRNAVIAAAKSIERGSTLAGALKKHPAIFPLSDRAMLEVGEKSGRLPEALQALAEWYELKAQIWRIIKSGMIRPVLAIHAAAFIIPIHMLFLGMWGEYILSVLGFLMIFYIPTGGMISLYRSSGNRGGFRLFLDSVLLKVPLLGRGLRDIALGRYCFGFWTLFVSGFPMPRCAEIAADLSGNAAVSAMLDGGKESARRGKPVSKGFSSKVPHDFLALWAVGEESGRLDHTLRHIYKERVEQGEYYLKEFSRWLPRFIYIVVAGVIFYYFMSKASLFTVRI
jgi:type II secretory pathway component PulF